MKKLLIAMGLAMALTSTGCTLYFGEDGDDYGDDDGGECPPGTYLAYDESGPVCLPDGGGYYCTSDYACAAGCYCDPASGVCVEAGYCTTDADCPDGTTCDESRNSCDPDGTPFACDDDADCGFGAYCDEATGSCIPSWTCDPADPAACGTGYTCQDGTCVPIPCEDNDDCAAGCYCDTASGSCVESCYCTTDDEAVAGGFGYCDEPRNTCMPGSDPTPACEELTTQADCTAREDCSNVYRGLNCSDPDGLPCTDGEAMCTCETYVWDECVTDAAVPPV
jgi:hypothetical protein